MNTADGKVWILRQFRHILRANSIHLRQPFSWRYPPPAWRTRDATHELLIFTLARQTKSTRLEIPHSVIEGCGTGDYYQRQLATKHIVEQLTQMHCL
jgi:hypothetical protein